MMKRILLAALALAATIPAAIHVQAQDDDDIYFSKKANKKAKYEAVYASAEADAWATEANNDWDLDDYNRRGKESAAPTENEIAFAEDAPFYYEIINEKGDTVKVPGNSKMLKGADINGYKVKHDTVVLVEQYHFSDLIRRFHNPFFGYYRYSPWYDVAYYDPFYWDYCYYDPWWYVTPSFGFHWGSWYGGWSFGYYSGWYGGWYSPYYSPMPHFHHYCYYDGPIYHYATGSSHRGSSRNNFGGHFAHRGGWRGDGGGSSRLASASSNRSYRAANGARAGHSNINGTYTAGPTLRGRNTVNGRMANSTMRSTSSEYRRSTSALGNSRGNSVAAGNAGSSTYSGRTHSAARYERNNSSSRRYDSGIVQGSSRPATSSSSNQSYSRSENRSSNSYNRSYNNNSSYSSSRSSSSYSSGSSYGGGSSSSGSYSRGGGGGGSHSGGGRAGRR